MLCETWGNVKRNRGGGGEGGDRWGIDSYGDFLKI